MFKVGDLVEIHGDSQYWDGAIGPVVGFDPPYVLADLTLAKTNTYGDAGKVRKNCGFTPDYFRLVDNPASYVPEDWS